MEQPEQWTCKQAATFFKTSPPVIKSAILNGTLKIGFVGRGEGGKDRIIVLVPLVEKYIRGESNDR